MRIAFIILLIAHAGIHLIGFSKEFWLLRTQTLNALFKSAGIVWLFSIILWLTTSILFGFKYEYWWVLGSISILSSQAIIFTAWSETKYGTIPNIIILLVLFMGVIK